MAGFLTNVQHRAYRVDTIALALQQRAMAKKCDLWSRKRKVAESYQKYLPKAGRRRGCQGPILHRELSRGRGTF
jgi:hypothetical protein